MKKLRPIRLKQLNIEAKLLHKHLNSDFGSIAKRYLAHPLFRKFSFLEFKDILPDIRLKYAYQVIAYEYGYERWADLKQQIVNRDLLFRSNGIGLIHKWFRNYTEAYKYHNKNGGYLLCFWADYIVCGIEYIQLLQLHHHSKDWELIGFNWVEPFDESAYKRLYQQALLKYSSL